MYLISAASSSSRTSLGSSPVPANQCFATICIRITIGSDRIAARHKFSNPLFTTINDQTPEDSGWLACTTCHRATQLSPGAIIDTTPSKFEVVQLQRRSRSSSTRRNSQLSQLQNKARSAAPYRFVPAPVRGKLRCSLDQVASEACSEVFEIVWHHRSLLVFDIIVVEVLAALLRHVTAALLLAGSKKNKRSRWYLRD